MRHRFIDIYVGIALSVMGYLAILLQGDWELLRLILTLPFMTFLPGYLMMRAIDQDKQRDIVDLLIFSIGTSIAVTILVGFILNWLPWGLTGPAFLIALTDVSLICALLALLRQREMPQFPKMFDWRIAIVCVMSGLLLLASFSVAINGLDSQPNAGFTQLWLVQASDQQNTISIGVTNHESVNEVYKLQLYNNKKLVDTWQISVKNNASWEMSLVVPSNSSLAADLYRVDNLKSAYRHVSLIIQP